MSMITVYDDQPIASTGQRPGSRASVVEVCDVHYSYAAGKKAVDGVSLAVGEGEVYALLGPNGAGKTTLLDLLEGFISPDEGSVRLFDADPRTQRATTAPLTGVMLQSAGFFDDLTVGQTIKAWRRFSADPIGTDEALATVDLDAKRHTRVGALSGGERRRLDFALATLGRPRLLFLDEPTTGLDPHARRELWAVVERMKATGTSVLLTTHYLEEAEVLADRVGILLGGALVREGTVAELSARESTSTVSFESARRPPMLPGERARLNNGSRREITVDTAQAQRSLGALLKWANAAGVALTDLQVHRASLEQIYLSVTEQGESR